MRYLIALFILVGVGCSSDEILMDELLNREGSQEYVESFDSSHESQDDTTAVTFPVEGELIFKGFGEYFQDRFTGYHVAIDLEAPADTPVYAVADGEVIYADRVSGYGGMMVIQHTINTQTISAIYGHLDPESLLAVGENVVRTEQIAVLGEEGTETDGEREHLHFALYEGSEVRLQGYESERASVDQWLNPVDVLGMTFPPSTKRATDLAYAQGEETFRLDFVLPPDWDIEYIPSIQSLNLYVLSGEGTARDRSQMLIRYFDASSFLTLSTVTIHSQEDLTVGASDYVARRYDIEKKSGVADFADQPSWRNERHIVTDFRGEEGFTRYYVVAANPELDAALYEQVLASMEVLE